MCIQAIFVIDRIQKGMLSTSHMVVICSNVPKFCEKWLRSWFQIWNIPELGDSYSECWNAHQNILKLQVSNTMCEICELARLHHVGHIKFPMSHQIAIFWSTWEGSTPTATKLAPCNDNFYRVIDPSHDTYWAQKTKARWTVPKSLLLVSGLFWGFRERLHLQHS